MTRLASARPSAARPVRRAFAALAWLVAVAVVAALLSLVPVPVYVVSPGPAFSLAEVISVSGADIQPIDGDYLFLTVQLDDARLGDAVRAGFDPAAHVISRESVLDGQSEEDFVEEQEGVFDDAESLAVRQGLELAGSDLDPTDVTIDSEGVGGPSAGLLTTLAVADLASPIDVAAGRLVTGTGRVQPDGTVTAVGGIQDKVRAAEEAGADVFLVPGDLADVARSATEALTVVAVDSVDQAFRVLADG